MLHFCLVHVIISTAAAAAADAAEAASPLEQYFSSGKK
jgi:hypothetical protein